MKLNKNENIIAFVYYADESCYIDESVEKEQNLIRYCKDKNYNIVKINRNVMHYSTSQVIINYSTMLKDIIVYNNNNLDKKINKIVIYDIEDLGCNEDNYATIVGMAKMCNLSLETIKQGIIEKDYLYVSKGRIINSEIKKMNEKYFIKENTPF